MNKTECHQLTTKEIADFQKWLEAKAQEHQLGYLLAHADDGVIWGRFDQGQLITADQAFPQLPKLRLKTLQQCRIFGQAGEVLLWRTTSSPEALPQNNWKHRFIGDLNCDCIPEEQMLWGTHKVEEKDGFTLVEDGSEGLRHAVPLINIPFSSDRTKLLRPLRLNVRHYIDYDEDGVARIYLSRLIDVTSEPRSKAG